MKIRGLTVVPYTLAVVVAIGAVSFPGVGKAPLGFDRDMPGAGAPKPQAPEKLPSAAASDDAFTAPKAFTTPPPVLPVDAKNSVAPTPTYAVAAPDNLRGNGDSRLEIGDKLKIVVYQRMDDAQPDKWGRDSDSGFLQRPEFSGDPVVEADGTISLALLGQFPVADRSARELEQAIAASFQQLTRHPGLVSIVSVERPPVYVLGPVKNPGTYKFTPGMTVLHAIALAGGFIAPNSEPWQQLEAVKAAASRRASLQMLPQLLARRAVLMAERDGGSPEPSRDLLQLTGSDLAQALIAREVERRNGIADARRMQRDALSSSLEMAQQQIKGVSKMQQPLDALIALRKERADAMKLLASKGQIGRPMVIQAQGDLMDAQQRRQDVSNQLASSAQRSLIAAQQDMARFEADTRTSLENEMTALDQQISSLDGEAATNLDVLTSLQPVGYSQRSAADQVRYTVVRRSSGDPVEVAATGLTTLRPGDLVKIDQSGPETGSKSSVTDAMGQPASSPILIGDNPP